MPESGLQYNIINIVIVTCITVVVLILSRNDLFEARPQEDNMTILKKKQHLCIFLKQTKIDMRRERVWTPLAYFT